MNKITMNPVDREHWLENNPFFPNEEEYKGFINATMAAAEEDNPLCFSLSDLEGIEMEDIRQFSQAFTQDTGLSLVFQFYTCPDCGLLHCNITVEEFCKVGKEVF